MRKVLVLCIAAVSLAGCGGAEGTARDDATDVSIESQPLVPTRGASGDLWADIIFGKTDFGEIMPNRVTKNRLFNPGGVLVDRSVRPNRVYVYDANSRVLGFNRLGHVASGPNAGKPCTSNSDFPGSICVIEEDRGADIVLGQPTMDRSACNGDGNLQSYPNRAPASASTLCGMPETQVSTTEGGSFANMAVDAAGNLYVPDFDNNRVVLYLSPFTTDRIADDVWGQADFTGNLCNRGRGVGSPDAQSLCLRSPFNWGFVGGVAIDSAGNLWVADNANHRVLRFPKDPATGRPKHVANLVLGQPNFTTANPGLGNNQMWAPAAVRVAGNGRVWVADSQQGNDAIPGCNFACMGRVSYFDNPTASGVNFTGTLNYDFAQPTGLELDPGTGGLWVSDRINNELLLFVNGSPQKVLFKDVPTPTGTCGGNYHGDGASFFYDGNPGQPFDPSNVCDSAGSIGVDSDGNVLVAASTFVQDVWRFPAPFPTPQPGIARSADARLFKPYQFGELNSTTLGSLYSGRGVAFAGSQLIVADAGRLLFWNNAMASTNGRDADGLVGATSARIQQEPHFGRIRQDAGGRLWAVRGGEIHVYTVPLTNQQSPTRIITSPLPVLGGGSLTWDTGLAIGGVAPVGTGGFLWVADPGHHRVFRVRNPMSSPLVDVVLGSKPADAPACNQGIARGSRTLCNPGSVSIDPKGNLWVSDHALEAAGNHRLLEFDANLFPSAPTSPIFSVAASRVVGTGGSFTGDCIAPLCGPWETAFSSDGQMIVGFNPYVGGSRFPIAFKNPLVDESNVVLNDYSSMSYAAAFDATDNYFVGDLNRGRVLAAKTPFVYARVNFQPSSAPAFPGYLVDGGAVYGARGNGFTYGWNADNAANTRDRNSTASPDQRYDTLNHMQKNGSFTWEIAVPNGTYNVRIVAGDPTAIDSVYRLTAEGVLVVSGTPSSTTKWFEGRARVTVGDGRLTIGNGAGSSNNKIDFIEVFK